MWNGGKYADLQKKDGFYYRREKVLLVKYEMEEI